MRLLFRILLPLLILAGAFWLVRYFILSKPVPPSREAPPSITSVEATRLKTESFPIYLQTQGTVRPRTTSNLIPEVNGRIVEISPNFREGGFFEQGEVLLKIDALNYETAIVNAQSNVAQATAALKEEEARAQQAAENWRRLGKRGAPSDMVLRKPQLAEVKARLAASQAAVLKAERDLERTQIRAPYSGRILQQNVDVGQYVSPGTVLGRAFATDIMEVRLPLTNQQLSFVKLPENFRGSGPNLPQGPEVEITSEIGRSVGTWKGQIVRVDSAIDERSRQLFVVAEVEDPYRRQADLFQDGTAPALKIGMFVDAKVQGIELEKVFVLPRSAVRVGGEVILIDENNRIRRQSVVPVWSGRDQVVVESNDLSGLKEGDVLCLTPLAYPANGALVSPTIDGVAPVSASPEFAGPGGPGKGGKGGKKGGKGKGKSGDGGEKGQTEKSGAGEKGKSPE